jgi:hypothetical protein
MDMDPEKRIGKRFDHESMVMVEEPDKGYHVHGTMFNFSKDGMYLETDFVCQPGTKIWIQMSSPPAKALPKILLGEVRWHRQLFEDESDYAYGLGVRLW